MKIKLTLLLTSISIALLCVSIIIYLTVPDRDMLLVWGDDGKECVLHILDPSTQYSQRLLTTLSPCKYAVEERSNRIIYISDDWKSVIVYSIRHDNQIEKQMVWYLNGLTISTWSHKYKNNYLYFSGVANGQEQVYRVDLSDGTVTQLTNVPIGIAHSPILSPDGNNLIYTHYLHNPDFTKHPRCIDGCIGQYYFLSLSDQTSRPLALAVEQVQLTSSENHCGAEWSPDGRFFTFTVTCNIAGEHYPTPVVASSNPLKITTVLRRNTSVSHQAQAITWMSNYELLYVFYDDINPTSASAKFLSQFLILDSISGKTESLAEFPARGTGMMLSITGVGWNQERQQAVIRWSGLSSEPLAGALSLYKKPSKELTFWNTRISDRGFFLFDSGNPMWSPSGRVIAYLIQETSSADFVDATGKEIWHWTASEQFRYFAGGHWIRLWRVSLW